MRSRTLSPEPPAPPGLVRGWEPGLELHGAGQAPAARQCRTCQENGYLLPPLCPVIQKGCVEQGLAAGQGEALPLVRVKVRY